MPDLPRIEEGQTFCWHRVLTSALRQFQPISKYACCRGDHNAISTPAELAIATAGRQAATVAADTSLTDIKKGSRLSMSNSARGPE
jgi:hypothetical protein